jgi:hypothetical protein
MRSLTGHLALALVISLAAACAGPPPALAPTPPLVASARPDAPPPPGLPLPTAEDKARVDETPESVIKALRAYRPERPETEAPTRDAVRAAARLNLTAARRPLLDVFLALRVSTLKVVPELYRDVYDAMVKLADRAWEPQLLERLSHPIASRTDLVMRRDEIFWQTVAASILGNLRSTSAVRPLLQIVLSPFKADIVGTAVIALIKIGKPAVGPATALLRSGDAELVRYSKSESLRDLASAGDPIDAAAQEAAESAHVGVAAIVLASIGRAESAPALIEVMGKSNPRTRAILAREIPKLPATPATEKAFQAAYDRTPPTLTLTAATAARESMIEAAGWFFDPALVPWMVRSALTLKGGSFDIDPIREATLIAALKSMKTGHLAEVDKLLAAATEGADGRPGTLGQAFTRESAIARSLLETCKEELDCYFAALVDPATQGRTTQFRGLKAAYMIGSLGGPTTRQRLVESLPKISNMAIRQVVAQALDHLSPRGDVGLADTLQSIVDAGEASKDPARRAGDAPLKTVVYRLRARAQ